jgi:acetyl-CoA synthetase
MASHSQDRAWRDFVQEVRSGAGRPFAEHWEAFQEIFAARRPEDGPPRVWEPSAEEAAASNPGRWMAELGFSTWRQLHAWSVREREEFWTEVIARLGIVFRREPERVLDASGGAEHPRWLPGAVMSIADTCFLGDPGRPAVISGREGSGELAVTSLGELRALALRFAAALTAHGFRPGDGVALYMPMTLECVGAYLGTVAAGCRVVSVADSFPPPELRRRLELGGARGVVTVEAFHRGGRRIGLYPKVCEAGAERAIVVPEKPGTEPAGLASGHVSWEAFLAAAGEELPEPVAGDPYRVTNVLFSSGTTGDPKAIPWTHLTPLKCAMDGRWHQDIRPGDVVAWPTNIGWMMGPWLIYASLLNGAALALFEGSPAGVEFTRFVERAGVRVLGVVPSLVAAWRAAGAVGRGLEGGGSGGAADWSGVRVYSSTGEPSNREDSLWLMSRSGYRAPVIEYCGGTEIGGGYVTGSVVQPACPATFTTPALGLDFVLLDEAGKPVGPGDGGEVFLLPPSVGLSQELLNRDHHRVYHAGCPAGPRGEVLRRHGDRLERLGGGFYRAQGRVDDTMNLGGIKVSSVEIERALDGHPAVAECAAVAVQRQGEGAERLVVFAVPAAAPSGSPPPDAGELRADLARRLATRLNPLFKIEDLVLLRRLPRTASNKLLRRSLRDRYAAGGAGAFSGDSADA